LSLFQTKDTGTESSASGGPAPRHETRQQMTRTLARIVRVDGVTPIVGADAIECAQIGGWTVVIKKDEYKTGDLAVYFEIDSFLPAGNPSWQFLVDKSTRLFNEVKGHVLRSIKLRGQVSQGLLLGLHVLKAAGMSTDKLAAGEDVSEVLGVLKYEAPVPAALAGIARGLFPPRVPKTDQERLQNLSAELAEWNLDPRLTWEVTEKLEGSSCTFAWLNEDLHVCSRNFDLLDTDDNSLWRLAKELLISKKFAEHFVGRNLALQGEIVGYGVQGNIYGLRTQKFFLFDVYDADQRRYLNPAERLRVATQMGLEQVPLVDSAFRLSAATTQMGMDSLLTYADGASALKQAQLREGLVFKANEKPVSFKIVSNKYLLKQSPV
jgi:RNA ligase (TIGR02306 family)